MNPGQTSAFGPVAPYYDELMKSVPYRMWVGYYYLLLSKLDVHPKEVLEVCCGTGTLCELLTAEGLRMTGLDLSEAMIQEARRKADRNARAIEYHVADASTFELNRTFDGALSFFDSLNNILEPERLRAAFERVYQHLRPGGSWIFDLNTEYAFQQQMFDQIEMNKRNKLRYHWVGDYDPETRLITVHMQFWYEGREFVEVHRQRAYAIDQVLEMLESVGFSDVQVFHSYTLNPPRKTSDRVHFAMVRE
jgi:ubiquinone/menaquinone biosynthesis C-methylase UbiE